MLLFFIRIVGWFSENKQHMVCTDYQCMGDTVSSHIVHGQDVELVHYHCDLLSLQSIPDFHRYRCTRKERRHLLQLLEPHCIPYSTQRGNSAWLEPSTLKYFVHGKLHRVRRRLLIHDDNQIDILIPRWMQKDYLQQMMENQH